MTATPLDLRRFALVARALTILADHPDGMRLAELADRLGVPGDQLRNEIAAYHVANVPVDRLVSGVRAPLIEFVGGTGRAGADETPPADGVRVRIHDLRPPHAAGSMVASFAELADLVASGRRQLTKEPDDKVLESALHKVADSVLAGAAPAGSSWSARVAGRLRAAGAERRRVRISYAAPWRRGVVDRVIEPYRVIHTRRGWEIDAAIEGRDDAVVTFMAAGIRSFDLLPDRFRRPSDIAARIERHRRPVPVELVIPYEARWAVELHSESAEVIHGDETLLRLRVHVVAPVASRLGLMLIAAGPRAHVIAPAGLRNAGRDLARTLLTHHGGP